MIPYGKHHLDEDDIDAVVQILRSNFLTQGPTVAEFEQAVADYVGARFAVAVTSGTAALHIAALAVEPDKGSSFITSPITFVASANAARYAGCDVQFVDIEPETVNMSPSALQDELDKSTDVSVIIPVHFGGLSCDMEAIAEVAAGKGALLIEDAAHALGAKYSNGSKVGSCCHSLMTAFSFHPVKNIACGEGGMVTTNDETIYRKLLRLRSHGINKLDDPFQVEGQARDPSGEINSWYYEMQELGFNYRLTDIQSALGLSQLRKLDGFLEKRIALAERYDREFASLSNARSVQSGLRTDSGNHLYVLEIDFNGIGSTRQRLMAELKTRGVGSQVHYIPVPAQPYYRNLGHDPSRYPAAWSYYERALTIPLYVDLAREDQDVVIEAVRELVG